MISEISASAFCPGHITGFFQIRDTGDETYKKGSLGSGFNTTAGASSKACFTPGGNNENTEELIPGVFLSIICNEISVGTDDLPVSRDMISRFFSLFDVRRNLSGTNSSRINLVLHTRFDLPLSQGFGMSGAGLISQVLALNRLFGSPFSNEDCFRMAHHSEIAHGTGLGDIPAQSVGGLTIREREGLPPYGIIHSLPVTNRVILAVLGSELRTRKIILDDTFRRSINKHGEGLVGRLLTKLPSNGENHRLDPHSAGPMLAEMTSLSFRFAQDTGLMDPETRGICREINKMVSPGSSMCMLGNSIFVIFPHGTSIEEDVYKKVKGILQQKGEVFETDISPAGARVL